MIFVTVGSQKFQFDRMMKKLDSMIENGDIKEEIFAQIGYCEYVPKNFKFKRFLDREEFLSGIQKSDLVITHAGTGAIMGGVKSGKKVIAVPRFAKFGEHVDDHQIQITEEFEQMQIIEACYDLDNLLQSIENCKNKEYRAYVSNTEKIVQSIKQFIDEI